MTGHSIYTEYQASLRRLETSAGQSFTLDDLKARVQATDNAAAALRLSDMLARPGGVELTPRALNQQIVAGRQLTPADAGKPVVVMPMMANISALPYGVGDKVTSAFGGAGGPERTYGIVGIYQMKNVTIGAGANAPYMPIDSFPDNVAAITNGVAITVEEAQAPALRTRLERVPGVFVLSINEFMQQFEQLFQQFSAFPIVVELISLLVGGIVIANSVALSTLERRREIAVMKAVGVQRNRVLGMLLTENGILGAIGGVVGVGLALLGLLVIITQPGFASAQNAVSIPYGTALGLLALCLVLSLAATMLTAWGASGEKPLNVLRYE